MLNCGFYYLDFIIWKHYSAVKYPYFSKSKHFWGPSTFLSKGKLSVTITLCSVFQRASTVNQHASGPKSCLNLVGSKNLAAKLFLFLLRSGNLFMVKQRNRSAHHTTNTACSRYLLSLMNSTNPALNNNGYLKANALIKQAKQVFTLCYGTGPLHLVSCC